MDKCIIFIVGAMASVAAEAFWRGASGGEEALWGGIGMLLLRRVVLRFPFGHRTLLCLMGALLLTALRLTFLILRTLPGGTRGEVTTAFKEDVPSFTYGLFRFLLIAPAYAVIQYLERCFHG